MTMWARIPSVVPRTRSFRRGIIWVAGLLLIFGAIYFSYVANRDCLGIGIDGELYSGYLERNADERAPFTQTGVDVLRGGVDAFYPLVRELLVPGFLTLPFTDELPGRPLTYFLYTPALILAFYIFARVMALDGAIGVLAGFICAIFLLPGIVHQFGLVQANLHQNPHWSQNLFLELLIVASFWAFDGRWRLRSVALLFAPMLCVVLAAVSTGPQLFFMIPAAGIYGASSLLDARPLPKNAQRLVSAALIPAGTTILGIVTYFVGLVRYTPLNFFAAGLRGHPIAWSLVSAYFWIEPFGQVAIVLGILGAVWTLLMASGRLRMFAVVHLVVKAVYFPIAYWLVFRSPDYHGSMPSYFELFILPFDFLFSAVAIAAATGFVVRLARRLTQIALQGGSGGSAALVAVVTIVVVYNVAQVLFHKRELCPGQSFSPVSSSPVIDILRRDIALKPGGTFRGLAATVTGTGSSSSVTWEDLAAHDYWLWRAVGNDYRSVGLWYFDIPSLFQLFTFTAPPFFLLTTDFLARPADQQTRSELVYTKIDKKVMQLWGVRYLITDTTDPPGALAASLGVDYTLPEVKHETLRLMEFPDPNVGNYSPIDVLRVPDFRMGLSALHDPAFDGRKTVVANKEIGGNFVPAADVRLIYRQYGFDVHAESAGQSLLVLPILFSHCWSVSSGMASLFRANLMQMGVKFSGSLDARLIFRYGPIWAGSCRLDDINDLQRLDLRGARASSVPAPPGG